jgi:hypothetical protein
MKGLMPMMQMMMLAGGMLGVLGLIYLALAGPSAPRRRLGGWTASVSGTANRPRLQPRRS